MTDVGCKAAIPCGAAHDFKPVSRTTNTFKLTFRPKGARSKLRLDLNFTLLLYLIATIELAYLHPT